MNDKKTPKEFVLQVLDGDSYRPITKQEFDQLSQEIPDIAKLFEAEDQSHINKIFVPEIDESITIYYHWEKAANRMMSVLTRHPSSMIFNEPVDPEKLGIKDYFDIIKRPMDFGTIKEKLKKHEYFTMRMFLEDVELVFENCLLYNGENTQVGHICKEVRDEYYKQCEALSVGFYITDKRDDDD